MTAKTALKLAQSSRWDDLKALLARCTPEGAFEAIKFTSKRIKLDHPLNGLIKDDHDVAGLTISGGLQLGYASRYRGYNSAAKVRESQWAQYLPTLHAANEHLWQAIELDPGSGLSTAFYMLSSVDAVEDGQKDIAEARLLAARDIVPSGRMGLMMARAEKWGGDHDTMFRIARANISPDIPGNYALIARAHYERELFYIAFDDSPDAAELAQNYYKGQPMAEMLEASEQVMSSKHDDAAQLRLAHGWLSMSLAAADNFKRAKAHIKALKGFEDPNIWGDSPFHAWIQRASITLAG